MPALYLRECIPVNSSLATRRDYGVCALDTAVIERDRKAVRDFLLRAAEYAGTDLSGLARRAGLSPSTVTRFVNGDSKHLPTTRTLSKIAEASGYAPSMLNGQDRGDLLEAFRKFASAVGVNLTEAALLEGADQKRLRRATQWLSLLEKLPPSAEHNLFELARGMAEAAGVMEQNANPGEAGRRRRYA